MQNRSVSPVISVILMIAIVVILTAVLSAFVLNSTESLDDPAPNVADTTGEFEPGADEQAVRITHVAGDNVNVENIEIIVRASGPELEAEARLVNLPGFDEEKDPENIISFFSREVQGNDPNTWSAGDTIQFEINVGGADFRDSAQDDPEEADTLEGVIVHTPSNSILSEHTFTP